MERRVLVVEDQALMSALLRDALRDAGFAVRSEPDVNSALIAVGEFDPDAAVLDIDLGPGPSGYDLGRALARTRPDIAVVFLTDKPEAMAMPADPQSLPLRAGFLLKRRVRDVETLVEALESVLSDQPERARQEYVPVGHLAELDDRQVLLLRMVAEGLTNATIAGRMGVSESSVERWLVALFRTLGVGGQAGLNPRVEAARRYIAACGLPETTGPDEPS